jgi:hypothetical protein
MVGDFVPEVTERLETGIISEARQQVRIVCNEGRRGVTEPIQD